MTTSELPVVISDARFRALLKLTLVPASRTRKVPTGKLPDGSTVIAPADEFKVMFSEPVTALLTVILALLAKVNDVDWFSATPLVAPNKPKESSVIVAAATEPIDSAEVSVNVKDSLAWLAEAAKVPT